MVRRVLPLLALVLCSACVDAMTPRAQSENVLALGTIAYVKNDYAEALRLLKPLAGKSNAKAAVLVGRMHYWGEGVKKNVALAIHYFKKAAKKGDKEGHYQLGLIHLQRREFQEAYSHLETAALQGYLFAKYELANLLAQGPPNLRDVCRAQQLYESIAQDYVPAWNSAKALSSKLGDTCASELKVPASN